jgi:Peptidase M15
MQSHFVFRVDIASYLSAQWPEVWEPLRIEFIRFCEQCRSDLGTPPLVITCLTRTPAENAAVGGKPKSLHLTRPCRAIDIRSRGFEKYATQMQGLWQRRGVGWDFVIEGPPYNRKPPHFHLEADWRVR